MHIHQHVTSGLHFSMEADEIARLALNDMGIADADDWAELDAQYDDTTLASNVMAFLSETDD